MSFIFLLFNMADVAAKRVCTEKMKALLCAIPQEEGGLSHCVYIDPQHATIIYKGATGKEDPQEAFEAFQELVKGNKKIPVNAEMTALTLSHVNCGQVTLYTFLKVFVNKLDWLKQCAMFDGKASSLSFLSLPASDTGVFFFEICPDWA
jgi:hypothetical protein